jgi:hypothetical protein
MVARFAMQRNVLAGNGLRLAIVFSLATAWAGIGSAQAAKPVFGTNVTVFDPSMKSNTMQAEIDKIWAVQQKNEFGTQRNALLFMPGEYKLDVPIGFYTEVIGLGATPDAVHITGNVHAEPAGEKTNATTTFWRAAEGFSVTPTGGTMRWAVSQAVPFRRMHVLGDIELHKNGGWASGGWMADSVIDGTVKSGPQQQWISRNSEWGAWTGSNWNMMFVGVKNPPVGEWPKPAYTKVAATPIVREKPFLIVDKAGRFRVRVPELLKDSSGVTWHAGDTAGRTIPLTSFYIALPGKDTAATINAALAQGKDLIFTPGMYELSEPIRVTRKDTVVMGLGFATLKATRGTAAMTVSDVDGVTVAGLLFDAGETKSPVLLEVGTKGSKTSHAKDPICLYDVFFRVGGAGVGSTVSNLTIHANDTIVDHTWIWRADHGAGVGWEKNLSANGLVVDGNDVTVYGLFVEHHQEYQVLWSGERGRTYFYQSEIPYDPPTQKAWTDTHGARGWASYKVADNVTQHEAWGLGMYSVFRKPDVVLDRSIEVPHTPGVRFHHMITVALDNLGTIENVIDDKGGATKTASPGSPRIEPKVTEFP